MQKNRIIVALDGMTEARALELAESLVGLVWGFKTNDLLVQSGKSIVGKLKQYGKVFVDPKFHDIPNTVKNGVSVLRDEGADFITIHASGGPAMIEVAVEAAGDQSRILSVTALTSLSSEETNAVYKRNTENTVIDLATLAKDAGTHGVVCSAHELSLLKSRPDFARLLKVVPGIRPSSYNTADDQKRTKTPAEAIAEGATHLVIGRPITKAENPRTAAEEILKELG